MSIANLLLGVWFILVGIDWLGWVSIDIKVLGILAFVVGLLVLLDGAGYGRRIG